MLKNDEGMITQWFRVENNERVIPESLLKSMLEGLKTNSWFRVEVKEIIFKGNETLEE